jgi:DNA-binding SARP family transcriptional activator/TolB-like protein
LTLDTDRFWSDAAEFNAAAQQHDDEKALSLYRRGVFLDGIFLSECAEFEQWLTAERARLRKDAVECVSRLINSAEKSDDMPAAAEWARQACEISPYDESLLRTRLTILVKSGNRADAVRVYREFAELIGRELDSEPSAQTKLLLETVVVPGQSNGSPPNPEQVAAFIVSEKSSQSAVAAEGMKRGFSSSLHAPIVFVALIAALVVFAATVYMGRSGARPPRVAVAQVDNRTGDPNLNALAEMATGGIVQQLAQTGVSVSASDGSHAPGSAVVTGSMYNKNDSVVVQMQIVDAAKGRVTHQLDPISAPAANAYLILDRLREQVGGAVAALTDTLYTPWVTAHSRPPNYAAFQEFMQGLDALVHTSAQQAFDHLRRAVSLDTGFVEAKIWLLEQASMFPGKEALVDSIRTAASSQRSRLSPFDQVSLDRELAFLDGKLEDTYTASRRLVAIAPATHDGQVYLAQAAMATRRYHEAIEVLHRRHEAKGWLKDLPQLLDWDLQAHRLSGDLARGLVEWRTARANSPESFEVCFDGIALLSASGRESDVSTLIGECAALPGAPRMMDRAYIVAGRGFRSKRYNAAAVRMFQKALAIRQSVSGDEQRRRRGMALVQAEVGDWQNAYENLKATLDTSDLDQRVTFAVVAAHVGDTASVSAILEKLKPVANARKPQGAVKMKRAFIVLAQGDRTQSKRLLHEAIREGVAPAWNAWYVRFELTPLRGDTEFEEMIAPRT